MRLTVKVTSRGQMTIPKQVRDKLGLRPGGTIIFVEKNGIFYIEKLVQKSPFDKWAGRLKTLKGKKSDVITVELRGT
ncbi:MAG: AbrB/MazE/SpoVT family DNA-binding domain-containing protein [Nitrospira sp.]|nr:AbrB/MazE/SpoVT family DNA-binding domain-containing protein [Nitrospira sp.]